MPNKESKKGGKIMRSTSQGIILVNNAKEKGGHQGISEQKNQMKCSSAQKIDLFPRKTNSLQAQAHPLLVYLF